MSSPPKQGQISGLDLSSVSTQDPRKVESIKQYYQQLCANYRLVSQQLQHPDLPASRRPALTAQLEKLQAALQEFTEKVIRPIINANKAAAVTRTGDTPVQSKAPTPVPSVGPSPVANQTPRTRPAPPTARLLTTTSRPENVMASGAIDFRGVPLMNSSTINFLAQTQPTEGILVETNGRKRAIGGLVNSDGQRTSLLSTLSKSLDPRIKLTDDGEYYLLGLADQYLETVCRGVCESARHRKRPGVSMKDFEFVISKRLEMPITTAGIPYAVPPPPPPKIPAKKTMLASSYHAKVLQLKKHLSTDTNLNVK